MELLLDLGPPLGGAQNSARVLHGCSAASKYVFRILKTLVILCVNMMKVIIIK